MATIGTFTKTNTGFNGTVQTLSLKTKLTLSKVDKSSDGAPDYRAYIDKVEVGAGWTRTSQGKREFVSIKIDDPSFAAPIYANLIERNGQHDLIWSR